MQSGAHLLFFLILAVGTGRAVAVSAHLALVVPLAAAVAAWYLCGIWSVRRRGLENGEPRERRLGQIWLGILVLGWVALVVADANFVWLAFTLFFLCFPLLATPTALVVTSALTAAALAATMWHGTTNTSASIIGPIFGALAAAGMAMIYQQLVRRSAQRQRLVDELTEAHRELLGAQDELVALQREAGALAERSRLARDIHDTLAQGFSSILLLSRAGERGPADPVAIFTRIADTAQQNLVEARQVVDALAPAALEAAPLHSPRGGSDERGTGTARRRPSGRAPGYVRCWPCTRASSWWAEAAWGEEAVAAAPASKPDVVLMDLRPAACSRTPTRTCSSNRCSPPLAARPSSNPTWTSVSTTACNSPRRSQRPGDRSALIRGRRPDEPGDRQAALRQRSHRRIGSGARLHRTGRRQPHRRGGRGTRTGLDHLTAGQAVRRGRTSLDGDLVMARVIGRITRAGVRCPARDPPDDDRREQSQEQEAGGRDQRPLCGVAELTREGLRDVLFTACA